MAGARCASLEAPGFRVAIRIDEVVARNKGLLNRGRFAGPLARPRWPGIPSYLPASPRGGQGAPPMTEGTQLIPGLA
jgi:hypothetical protein